MTDTQEQDTNAITRQTPEELSEQETQTVNGGLKVEEIRATSRLNIPHLGSVSDRFSSMSRSSSVSESATENKKGWSKASKAEAAAVGTGTATSFGVGLTAGALENKL